MKTRTLIRSCAVGLLGAAACEGNAWPTNAAAPGLDASASVRDLAVDASSSMGSSHPVWAARLAAVDEPRDATRAPSPVDVSAAVDVAAEAATPLIATPPATVFFPVYVPFFVPFGQGGAGEAPPAVTAAQPTLVTPAGAAPIGNGSALGQYGTPGAFSSTGVTAGDPGTLRGTPF